MKDDYKAVQNMQYCMPSQQKANVDQMNAKSGYWSASDRANTGKWPSKMHGAKSNAQRMK